MKRKRNLLTITVLLLTSLLFTGCQSDPEEIIPTFYNNGVYSPEDETYSMKLPNEKWEIKDEENPEDITFVLNRNKISIKRYESKTEKYQNKITEIPVTQEALENQIKENNIKEYTIISFRNNVFFDEKYNLRTTRYIYSDEDNGNYDISYFILNEEYLYEIKGSTTNEDTVEELENTFNNFILNIQNENIKVFKIKDDKLSGNTYKSDNNEYTITLPYMDWKFQVPENSYFKEEDTIISTDGIEITIHEQSKHNSSNIVIYEIPTTLEILNKQIKIKDLGNYEIIDFKLETVGTLPDYEEEQEYTKFSYLIKCDTDSERKFYAYTEYRFEDITYQLTGTSTLDNLTTAVELNQILKSFYPTSNF